MGKAYIGISGAARTAKKMYIGVDGKARKVKKGYIGVNGVARPFFSAGVQINWTKGTLPTTNAYQCVTYGGGKFVALSENGDVAYSTDGLIWRASALPDSLRSRFLYQDSIAYGNGMFFATAGGDKDVYSADGVSWGETYIQQTGLNGVAFGDGVFAAVGNGKDAYWSEDGVNWELTTLDYKGDFYGIAYGGGWFATISRGGVEANYSADGKYWLRSALPSSDLWRAITYGNGMFVAFPEHSDVFVYSETNGLSWKQGPLPRTGNWRDAAFGDGVFVLCGADEFLGSEDGKEWSRISAPYPDLRSITFGAGKFVAVGSNGHFACGIPET